MTDTTTATFYLHSTALGGKTIAELDQNGYKTTGYVYTGGARIATQRLWTGGGDVAIECTNPVTGAALVTDANASSASRQEPDPLGRELAQAPDPTVVVDPISSSKWNEPMPIEASWGPSAQFEQANAARAAQMDAYEVEKALFFGHRATWDLVLHKNPNVGVRTEGGRTLYGVDGANYLASGGGMNDELAWLSITTTGYPMGDYPQKNGNGAGVLSPKDQLRFDKARAETVKNIQTLAHKVKSKCAAFLNRANISLSSLQDAVSSIQAFDGGRSSLSIGDAGLIDLKDPDFSSLPLDKQTEILNESVSSIFRQGSAFGAATGINNWVFFNTRSGLNSKSVFHEGLHVASGLGDVRLATELKLKFSGGGMSASLAINDALRKYGCIN